MTDIAEPVDPAQLEARRLASLKETARGLGFTLVQELVAQGYVSGQPPAGATMSSGRTQRSKSSPVT